MTSRCRQRTIKTKEINSKLSFPLVAKIVYMKSKALYFENQMSSSSICFLLSFYKYCISGINISSSLCFSLSSVCSRNEKRAHWWRETWLFALRMDLRDNRNRTVDSRNTVSFSIIRTNLREKCSEESTLLKGTTGSWNTVFDPLSVYYFLSLR